MIYLPIILGSTRIGRQSSKVAQFLLDRMRRNERIETEIIDLLECNFPMMEERLRFQDDPPAGLREFSAKIARAHGIAIVSPEYNNGYPAVLKNALDYLGPNEYKRKPVGIVTVSAGGFGGLNCLAQLRLITLGLGAFPIPASLPISSVQKSFTDEGNPVEAFYEDRATSFINELLWFAEAVSMRQSST